MASGQRKAGCGMVETRWPPCGCIVTGFAKLGYTRCYMARIHGCIKGWRMTRVAIGRSAGKTAGMAFCTQNRSMRSGKRETGGRMIKRGIQPVVGIVAHLAIRWVSLGLMIFSPIILNLMTGQALRLGSKQSSLMTVGTLGDH